jgi:hypothetical protein
MHGTPLSRHAGPIVLVAGTYLVITHLVLLFVVNRGDVRSMVADPLYQVASVAYAAAFAGLLIALFAAYARQALEAGTFGLAALFAAIVGTFTLGADMWFEAFATPWLAEVVPQILTAERKGIWVIGYFSSYVLFALGWVMFGLASLRARVFPVRISVALAVAGFLGFLAAGPPWAVPLGLALMWLGGWLIRTARTGATTPDSAIAIVT